MEQLRQYFEVRFRTEKYGVPYFFGVSEATHGKRPQEQERVAVEDLNVQVIRGYSWAATESPKKTRSVSL